jgi:hypothetical protein
MWQEVNTLILLYFINGAVVTVKPSVMPLQKKDLMLVLLVSCLSVVGVL